MKKRRTILFLLVAMILSITTVSTNAQLSSYDFKMGIHAHYLGVLNEFEPDGPSFMGRPYLRFKLGSLFDLETGAGIGFLNMKDYDGNPVKTMIIPADVRLLISPVNSNSWNPYLYAGVGVVYYTINTMPINPVNTPTNNNLEVLVPAGGGIEFSIGGNWLIDLTGGYNIAFSDFLDGYEVPSETDDPRNYDNWWNAGIGLAYSVGGCEVDPDKDGLSTCEEEIIKTDPHNADTDSDGLKDGEEIQKYNTDPLSPDSDNDELKDGEEVNSYRTNPKKIDTDDDGLNDFAEVVTYKSNPLKADTDGDALNDYEEVNTYKTDPTKADTDSDALKDGEEVNTHKTDPRKADSDSDELIDGAEVNIFKTNPLLADTDNDKLPDGVEINTHRTNPLVADTDGGGVDDFIEVTLSKTDPLNKDDDIPSVSLEIEFRINSFEISSVGITNLNQILPDLTVFLEVTKNNIMIIGHTDTGGSESYNQRISEKRAQAVYNWFISNGIKASRLKFRGDGETNPRYFPGSSPRNRRIELRVIILK